MEEWGVADMLEYGQGRGQEDHNDLSTRHRFKFNLSARTVGDNEILGFEHPASPERICSARQVLV